MFHTCHKSPEHQPRADIHGSNVIPINVEITLVVSDLFEGNVAWGAQDQAKSSGNKDQELNAVDLSPPELVAKNAKDDHPNHATQQRSTVDCHLVVRFSLFSPVHIV